MSTRVQVGWITQEELDAQRTEDLSDAENQDEHPESEVSVAGDEEKTDA